MGNRASWRAVATAFALLCLVPGVSAQATSGASARRLIVTRVDPGQLKVMRGNTPPWARPANDQGAVAPELELERMLLVLHRGAEEESALQNLLAQQQDAASSQYHAWLTPAQFGSRFGLGAADLKTIEDWLRGAGFHALTVSRGRNVIEFSGTAAQVEAAFHTPIHRYRVSAAQYWSNANDPAIPAALAPAVAGVVSLNNFRRRPEHVVRGLFSQRGGSAVAVATAPQFTYSGNCGLLGSGAVQNCFAVGPNDLAAIYNVTPLWNAGVDGSGETIAMPARADLTSPSDITAFRSAFGLPADPPTIILNGPDPGGSSSTAPIVAGDRIETKLGVEWAGAVAKGASVDVVISASTASTDGIDLSNLYIVDNNVAPILSVTYGACELGMGTAGNLFYDQLWEQAAAEGISVFVAAGDSGAAGCDQGTGGAAVAGLAVNGLASPPWAIAVGGTDFDDLQDGSKYWATTNNPQQASALGYIPETVWNDSCTNAEFSLITGSSSAVSNCNNPQLQPSLVPAGGGGGKSACTTSDGATPASCSGGYAKPAWQPANGDGARDLPDVSLFAGNGFNGNAYIVCDSNLNAPCITGPDGLQDFFLFGGTSLATPVWAGIQALVNQKMGSRQGNPAYVLYSLASQQTGACDSSSSPGANCVFLDITRGTNAMACARGSADCTAATAYGILPGYNALAGYDLASGLGSVNVANLINAWGGVKFTATNTSLQLNPTSKLIHGQAVTATVSVTPQSGSGLPTGAVSLETSSGASVAAFPLNASGGASGATNALPGGTYTVTAHYSGDARFAPSRSQPVAITITPEPSTTAAAAAASDGYNNLGLIVSRPYGSAAYFTAQIRGQSGYGAPGGAVTFTLDGQPFSGGPYILSNQGYASTLGRLYEPSVGQHTLLASYPGDASFAASASAPLVFTITPGPTETTIAAPAGILHLSPQPVEINADVLAPSWVTGQTPAGTVQFYYNQKPLGAAQTVAGGDGSSGGFVSGVALFNAQLPFGPGTLSAAYSGDGNFAPSKSAPVSVEVQAQASLKVTAPASVQEGQPVAVAFTVTSSFASGPAIGGTIQATANEAGGASQNATLTVSNGAAQWNLASLPVGTTTVAATYSGDANYLPSIGISTAQMTVAGPTFAMTAGNSSMTVSAPGGSATTTISTQAIDGFTAAIAFSCTGLPAKSACSFTPLTVAAGGATKLTITTTAASALPAPGTGGWPSAGFAAALFFCLGGLMLGVRQRWVRVGAIAALAGALAGCGGSGSVSPPAQVSIPGTPVGTSTVSVVGTGGGVTKTLSVTLTVQ